MSLNFPTEIKANFSFRVPGMSHLKTRKKIGPSILPREIPTLVPNVN